MSTLGRNQPCHCGSGKKYKRCHWESDKIQSRAPLSTNISAPLSPPISWSILIGGGVACGVFGEVIFDRGLMFVVGWSIIYFLGRVVLTPPPPNPNAGDPAALNFGREAKRNSKK